MLAAKMFQIVSLENPDSDQRMAPAGVLATKTHIAAMVTPMKPTAAPGSGSAINPAMTAANSAKKCQALGVSPARNGNYPKQQFQRHW